MHDSSRTILAFPGMFRLSMNRDVTHTFTEVGPHEMTLTQIVVSTGGTLRMDALVMVKVCLCAPPPRRQSFSVRGFDEPNPLNMYFNVGMAGALVEHPFATYSVTPVNNWYIRVPIPTIKMQIKRGQLLTCEQCVLKHRVRPCSLFSERCGCGGFGRGVVLGSTRAVRAAGDPATDGQRQGGVFRRHGNALPAAHFGRARALRRRVQGKFSLCKLSLTPYLLIIMLYFFLYLFPSYSDGTPRRRQAPVPQRSSVLFSLTSDCSLRR